MPLQRHFTGLVCAFLLACGSEAVREPEKQPDALAVFPNLPLPPGAQFVSRAGSSDALQITLFSPAESDKVIGYYRNVLSQGNWRLVSDVKKPDGTVLLYAEQDGPPIWVSVWPTTDRKGTMVQLAGAMATKDTAKVAGSRSKPAGT